MFNFRFSKNIRITFYHLYRCPEEDKSKVIRVLNLWQKNSVFPSEIIQPLFDLADPRSEISRQTEEMVRLGGKATASGKAPGMVGSVGAVTTAGGSNETPSKLPGSSPSSTDQQMNQQLQTILQLLKNHAQSGNEQVKFNKKLLDFDYSDDEEGGIAGNDHQTSQEQQQPSPAMLEALQG